VINFRRVDFPLPFFPIIQIFSPGEILKDKSLINLLFGSYPKAIFSTSIKFSLLEKGL
jgi:hypothetical protein